jgi:hypothetical protein
MKKKTSIRLQNKTIKKKNKTNKDIKGKIFGKTVTGKYNRKYNRKYNSKNYRKNRIRKLTFIQEGGSLETATKTFINATQKKTYDLQSYFNADKSHLITPENDINIIESPNEAFDAIYNYLIYDKSEDNKKLITDNIDFIIFSYIKGTFGKENNSIENIGTFLDCIKDYKMISNNTTLIKSLAQENPNIISFQLKNLTNLEGLRGLINYLDTDTVKLILEKIHEKIEKKHSHKDLRREAAKGINDVIEHLNNGNIVIYEPTSENGSKFYGNNTKWCTAALDNKKNMFKFYYDMGPLYIIQSKKEPKVKYQIHFQTNQIMDPTDGSVDLEKFLGINENKLIKLINLIKQDIKYNNDNDNKYNRDIKDQNDNPFGNDKDLINWIIPKLKEVKILNMESISKCPINIVYFINLETLNTGYDDKTKDILTKLPKLKNLGLDEFYNYKPDFFNGLDHLEELTLFDIRVLDDNLLSYLTNLKSLNLGDSFSYNLGNKLDNLVNLEKLTFGSNFNAPLDQSLNKLIKLKELTFGHDFNKPLDYCLEMLTNLETLTFGHDFNQNVKHQLKTLKKLKTLTFGNGFENPLYNSLNELEKLENLTFGNMFNNSIDVSMLKNITKITVSIGYNSDITLPEEKKSEKIVIEKPYNNENY